MQKNFNDVDSWFEAYEEMDEKDQYEFVLETMKNPLVEGFIEEIEFVDILISTKEHLLKTHQLHKLKEFIEVVKSNQPEVYEEGFQYIEDTAISYYLFNNDMDSVKEALKIFIDEPVESIEKLIALLKKIQYYNKKEIAVNLSKAVLLRVCESDNLMFDAETDFVWSIYLDALEEMIYKLKDNELIDYDLIVNGLSKYNSTIKRERFDTITEMFDGNEILFRELDFSSKKKREAALEKIRWSFADYMLEEKGIDFTVSLEILENMENLLEDSSLSEISKRNTKQFFNIISSDLDAYIDQTFSSFFYQDEDGEAALFWGIPYFYGFLLSKNLISDDTYQNTLEVTDDFKKGFIMRNKRNLWEYNFVHCWDKPDHLSQEEFEAEEELFKDTLEKTIYIEGEEEYLDELRATQSSFGGPNNFGFDFNNDFMSLLDGDSMGETSNKSKSKKVKSKIKAAKAQKKKNRKK